MMPANADPPENVCVTVLSQSGFTNCRIQVVGGQHTILIFAGSDLPKGGCHYNVTSHSSGIWHFGLDHGPEKCSPSFHIAKVLMKVRGN